MYLYHGVPTKMLGDTLIPLNQMRNMLPEVYSSETKKYHRREHVMEQTIPILNCKWNDVLHLTPLAPNLTLKALRQSGFNPPNCDFFKIPISKIDETCTVIFEYKGNETTYEKEYKQFIKNNFSALNEVPCETFSYYIECRKKNISPLMYHFVPHVLTSSAIAISDLSIIHWYDEK